MEEVVMDNNEKDILLAKLERAEKSLNLKVEEFAKLVNTLSSRVTSLTLETEEQKKHRLEIQEEFPNIIDQSVQASCKKAIPIGLNSAMDNIHTKLDSMILETVQKGEKFKGELEASVISASQQLNLQGQAIRRQGIIIACSIFLSAAITSCTIGYFFPRYVNNQYTVSGSDLTSMMIGDIYLENKELWNKNQHDLFIQKLKEKLNKRFDKQSNPGKRL